MLEPRVPDWIHVFLSRSRRTRIFVQRLCAQNGGISSTIGTVRFYFSMEAGWRAFAKNVKPPKLAVKVVKSSVN
jgi:hypothetical protein